MAASVKRFYNLKKHLGVVSNARLKKDTHPEGAYFAGGTAELVFFFFFLPASYFLRRLKLVRHTLDRNFLFRNARNNGRP